MAGHDLFDVFAPRPPATLGLPTAWREMRWVIIAALHHLGGPFSRDEADVQRALLVVTGNGVREDVRLTGVWRRAYYSALDDLVDQGVVIDDQGLRLAIWGPRPDWPPDRLPLPVDAGGPDLPFRALVDAYRDLHNVPRVEVMRRCAAFMGVGEAALEIVYLQGDRTWRLSAS